MLVEFKGSIFGVVKWQWRSVVLFCASSIAVVLLHKLGHLDWLRLPSFPLTVVGSSIGIFVSFRTNSAYDRWWEGRKLWGRMVNVSRHLCTQSLVYMGTTGLQGKRVAHAMIRRQIAYVHVLRCLLRGEDPLQDEDAIEFISSEERTALEGASNMTHALVQLQAEQLVAFADANDLDPMRLQSIDESLREVLAMQGGCERIRNTPMPRGYAYFAQLLIKSFGVLLPLGLVGDLGWFTVPVTVLVCMAFELISEVGRVLEDPFSKFWNALPLSALSKTIEIDLRERLGETSLPAMPKPVNGVLM